MRISPTYRPIQGGPINLNVRLMVFSLLAILFAAGSAQALLRLDFEQKYFSHKHRQVWDFSIVRPDSVFHIYYHTIHEGSPSAAYADTIWHSTSQDLKHWTLEVPILVSGQGDWDSGALWAPDVFFDEASGLWKMAFTGCDDQMNQRICLAESPDLYNWTKLGVNPVLEPDPEQYIWDPDQWWSDFRDPFIYRQDDQWHILVTAKQWLTEATGVLYHGVSDDLLNWTDVGAFFENDGADPWRVLESPQYKVVGEYHYLFFGEYDTSGLSVIASRNSDNWTMDDREFFDYGYAPEIDEFDPGNFLISRLAPYNNPQTEFLTYVVRMDTLLFNLDGTIDVYKAPPLDDGWKTWSGISCLANPTFGDNPEFRGDEPVGMVGNSYFGSSEYYQGPLSGRGSPGTRLGDGARGDLTSYPFIATGDRIELLVSGGYYPETCFVALVDAATDETIYSETGNNQNLMTLRTWDLSPYQGRMFYIQITDDENQEMGFINVDEIVEVIGPASAVLGPDPRQLLESHGVSPNPFNPMTMVRFTLADDLDVVVRIHDVRGREVWASGLVHGTVGNNFVSWQGMDHSGQPAPAGTYLYSIESGGSVAASGKLSLVK